MILNLTTDYTNELEKKIDYVTRYNSKAYYKIALKKISRVNPENSNIICDYIMAEQIQMNIKESTKEGKIKVLVWLTNYFRNTKSFRQMTKGDILDYLNVYANQSMSNDPSFCFFINWHVLFSYRIKVYGMNAKNHLVPTP